MSERRRNVALVGLLLLAVVGGGYWWTHRGLPDDVAVRVSDTDVSVTELRSRMAIVQALYGVSVPSDDEEAAAFWRDAAQSVAVSLVLADQARAEDVTITDNAVDASLTQFVKSFFGGEEDPDAAFAEALGNAGTSEGEVREELRRQLEVNALFATITGDVPSPSDAEVEAAYTDRRCRLEVAEQRRIRNIVVPTRGEAQDAVRRLRSGTPFAAVVSSLSIDESTRDAGGDLGLVGRAQLEASYAEEAFSTAAGDLFGPVQGEYGWNVGRVEKVVAARTPALDEIRDDLRTTLFTEAQSDLWRAWLRDRIKAADVEYADTYLPEDPLALPSTGAGDAEGSDDPVGGC
jgi:peptidyl-prolyl cis-trans isomerase C